jgi:hypothetical protein
MIAMLELFEGKVTLTELMSMEIPLANELMGAKERLLKEKEKARVEAERKAQEAAKANAKSKSRK